MKPDKKPRTRMVPEWWLAAALCQIPFKHPDGTVKPLLTHEEAKMMTADQVIELYQKDHYPLRKETGKALGMTHAELDVHWNIQWLPILWHRKKSAEIDMPEIAKSARIIEAGNEMRRKLLARTGQAEEPTHTYTRPAYRWVSRPMDGSKNSQWKKPMRGPAVRRTP